MTSLTAIFGSSSDKPEDDETESEKLLNLYWNRAELKKEFAELRNEKLRLEARVAEQDGAVARAEQKLGQLESLLLDSTNVYSTVTYFQLRALNLKCASKIATFAEKLKQQREKRVHSQLVEQWNEARRKQVAAIEAELGEQRIQAQMLEDRLQAERHRLATMSGFVKLFRGRSVTASLDGLAEKIHAAEANENAMLLELESLQSRQPPDTQGLDTATKRTINCMILAYAQKLYLVLREHEVADLANEAGEKSAGALNYGDKQSCEQILARVAGCRATLVGNREIADEMQERAQLIAERARFQSADDAVPISSSVATVFDFREDGSTRELERDLLAENYWRLSRAVSR